MAEKDNHIRFAVFDILPETRELRKHGVRIKLEDQPFELLLALLEKPGEIVTRAELQSRLWPDGTFVDFEKSLTKAVNKIRTALDDSATTPRFVETLARRGYRFIAPVTAGSPEAPQAAVPPPAPARPRRVWLVPTLALLALLVLAGALGLSGVARLFSRGGVPRLESLAVLPIGNLTGDAAYDYFADSFTDDLISDLGRIGSLRVISRTSVARYKEQRKPIPEIARELGVDALVEGSVQRSEDRLRINVKLLLAATERQLWTESYLGDAGKGAALGWNVARAVAHQVSARFTAEPAGDRGDSPPPNPRAYDAYVRGRHLWNLRGIDRLNQATTYFEQAVREDPRFALAWSGLADCYSIGWGRPVDGPTAEKHARKAVELEPGLAEAQVSLAFSRLVQYRWEEGAAGLRRAIGLNPNYVPAHQFYTIYLLALGRLDEALAENDRALQLDPFSLPVNNLRGWVLTNLRRYGDAAEHLRNAATNPGSINLRWQLARVFWLQRRPADAIAVEREAASVVALHGNDAILRGLPAVDRTLARQDFRAACLKSVQLKEAYPDLTGEQYIPLQYALLQDSAKVLEWIARLRGNYGMIMVLNTAPEFDFLRADPRFIELLRGYGVKP